MPSVDAVAGSPHVHALLRDGHHPRLITSHPGPPSRAVEDRLPILRLPRPPQGRLLRRRYEPYLTDVPLTYAALRLGRYDVAHALHTTDTLAALGWKRRSRAPAILSFMGIPDRPGLRAARRRLELMQSAIRGCDAVVALSQYAADAFRYWLGYEARVIAPGVDLDAFRPSGPRTQDLQSVRRIGIDVDAAGIEWRDLDSRTAVRAKLYPALPRAGCRRAMTLRVLCRPR